jgi:CheY-like chemotaxis protein
MKEHARIVLADDEVHILRILDLKLTAAGFTCIQTCNGLQAWQEVVRSRPNMLITDYQMPGMTGLELAEKMHQDYDLRDIPVILLTAHGFTLRPEDLTDTNILHRVSKPFSPREVLGLVQDLLTETSMGE